MKDYWSELEVSDAWGKRERFNYLMSIIDSIFDSSSSDEQEETYSSTSETTESESETGDLSLTITDTSGDSISDATVTLTGSNTITGVSDNDGEVILTGIVKNEEYELTISADNYNTFTGSYTLTVDDDTVTYELSIVTVNVKVNVNDGVNGISGASVVISDNVNDYTGTTGSAGGCTVRNVPLGEYTIEASKEGYIAVLEDLTVVLEDNEITISLEEDDDDDEL